MTGDDETDVASVRVRERATTRTARYALLGAEPARARRIWFALHGYGMLATRFIRAFDGIIPDDTCVVAPEGLSRFYLELPRADGGHLQRVGATWLTRESRDTDIADAHRWLDSVQREVVAEATAGTGVAPLFAVLGFSQGVATAMRWIGASDIRPRQFVAWAGGLATDVDAAAFFAALAQRELRLVVGDGDPYVTPQTLAAITAALSRLTVRYRVQTFTGAHHLEATLLRELLVNLA